ncbi:hypothetical protein SAMN04487782_2060 [Stenotrophomonas maltophilia]|nr:hypothetical protein SAMN04487782_2060 [Stenotrophomonas maltophilia]
MPTLWRAHPLHMIRSAPQHLRLQQRLCAQRQLLGLLLHRRCLAPLIRRNHSRCQHRHLQRLCANSCRCPGDTFWPELCRLVERNSISGTHRGERTNSGHQPRRETDRRRIYWGCRRQ